MFFLFVFLIELKAMYWLVTVPPGGQAVGDGALGPRGRTLQRETSFQTRDFNLWLSV